MKMGSSPSPPTVEVLHAYMDKEWKSIYQTVFSTKIHRTNRNEWILDVDSSIVLEGVYRNFHRNVYRDISCKRMRFLGSSGWMDSPDRSVRSRRPRTTHEHPTPMPRFLSDPSDTLAISRFTAGRVFPDAPHFFHAERSETAISRVETVAADHPAMRILGTAPAHPQTSNISPSSTYGSLRFL